MATTAPVSDASIVFLPVGKVYNSHKDGDTKSSIVIVPIFPDTVLIFGRRGNFYANFRRFTQSFRHFAPYFLHFYANLFVLMSRLPKILNN